MPDGFHDHFLAALAGDTTALAPWCDGRAAEAGLSVHRNTIAKGRGDALAAQFPTVERVVGPAWLAAAASAHGRETPPMRASLLAYGEDFPDWLAAFPPAAEMPYLADLARIDWLWTSAHLAADAAPLDPGAVAALRPHDFERCGLGLHPATRFAAFADSAPSLWRALQPTGKPPGSLELGDAPEAILLTRPALETSHQILALGAFAFLDACAGGKSLADAAAAALTHEPSLDLSRAFADLVSAGAFTALRILA